jgi:hypothetical protein
MRINSLIYAQNSVVRSTDLPLCALMIHIYIQGCRAHKAVV